MKHVQSNNGNSFLILLTGTIAPIRFSKHSNSGEVAKRMNVRVSDETQRLAQYESAITRYIKESVFTDIVFVENSGYDFPVSKYEQMAKDCGKKFEFLYRCLTPDDVRCMLSKGKSWGEADLIDYAMINSKLIRGFKCIYKCTGRIFLTNSKKIVNSRTESEFLKSRAKDKLWAQTYFFKLNVEDYFRYLQQSINSIDDYHDAQCIESVWYDVIRKSDMAVKCFKRIPRLSGTCAGNNEPYDKPKWKYFLMDLYLAFGGKKEISIK
jgi:hypothetical protein